MLREMVKKCEAPCGGAMIKCSVSFQVYQLFYLSLPTVISIQSKVDNYLSSIYLPFKTLFTVEVGFSMAMFQLSILEHCSGT